MNRNPQPCSQFHQNFMSSYSADILLPQKMQSQTVNRENLHKTLSYKKADIKMLVKLTPVRQRPRV
jgi:hypothetical protein